MNQIFERANPWTCLDVLSLLLSPRRIDLYKSLTINNMYGEGIEPPDLLGVNQSCYQYKINGALDLHNPLPTKLYPTPKATALLSRNLNFIAMLY
jgi:hypothetical protein